MENNIFEMIKRASVFMILSQAILHFGPGHGYDKYLKVISGIMTMVILVIPVFQFIKSKPADIYMESLKEYENSISDLEKQVPLSYENPENSQLYTIEEEIKCKLEKIANEEGITIKTTKICGLQEFIQTHDMDNIKIEIVAKRRKSGISTIRVDKIKLTGNSEGQEDGRKVTEEEKRFCKKAVRELEIQESMLEVKMIS